MRYYELLYIVNSNFEKKKIDETMKKIDSRMKKTKSKIINHIIWGKKKLAYPMQGNKYGTYVLIHYQGGDKKKLNDFDSWLKLSDLVIRHMIIRLEAEPDLIEKIEVENNYKEKKEIKSDDESNDKEEIANEINDDINEEVE